MNSATAALFRAISEGDDIDCGQAVRDGADMNAINAEGFSVIQMAALSLKPKPEVVSFLIDSGTKVDMMGTQGGTALYWSVFHGRRDICRVLMENEADPEMRKPTDSFTAMGTAAYKGRTELFQYLAQKGANLHSRQRLSGDVLTPLQLAVRYRSIDIVRYCVIECGMDMAKRTLNGKSLIQLAGKNEEIKSLLRSLKTELAVQDVFAESKLDSPKSKRSDMSPL